MHTYTHRDNSTTTSRAAKERCVMNHPQISSFMKKQHERRQHIHTILLFFFSFVFCFVFFCIVCACRARTLLAAVGESACSKKRTHTTTRTGREGKHKHAHTYKRKKRRSGSHIYNNASHSGETCVMVLHPSPSGLSLLIRRTQTKRQQG